MRFIDLEHELGHLHQILTRFIAQGISFYQYEKKPGKVIRNKWRIETKSPEMVTMWQNGIMEYHNRLEEFRRLEQRGVDLELLQELSESVQFWAMVYWSRGVKHHRSPTRSKWATAFFPEIPELEEYYLAKINHFGWYNR